MIIAGLLRIRYLNIVVCITGLITASTIDSANAQRPNEKSPFSFEDVSSSTGLIPAISKIQAHGAGWGDANGDGWPDLFVATFHYNETGPNQLLWNQKGNFEVDDSSELQASMRATGVVFADLDNDGDLDLYVASMPAILESRTATRHGHPFAGCSLYENLGAGKFNDISKGNDACPAAFGGRSACVLDYNGDGLLDILVGEDPNPGYNGSETNHTRLFRNKGRLQYEDVSRDAGIPEAAGLGVAAADMNGDTLPDIFIVSTLGNHLLINKGNGQFEELENDKDVFAWPNAKGDNMVCGVAIADVNGDALPDVYIGQHFDHPWKEPEPNRLYLNQGNSNGHPSFKNVTDDCGLPGIPMKSPHVEIQDFDNDGRVDLYGSVVKFADEKPHPMIFRNMGNKDGKPQYDVSVLSVNDFPSEEDRNVRGSRKFFEKMIAEKKVFYSAPGPSCDFDRDGRIDLFIGSWWSNANSMLLKNKTPGGNWLDVRVQGNNGVNRMGIGSKVEVFEAGKLGDSKGLIGTREIAKGSGYASSSEAVAHFGLVDRTSCDIRVTLPFNKGMLTRTNVKINQRITIIQGQ